MRAINYPTDPKELRQFHQDYVKAINKDKQAELDTHLKGIKLHGKSLNFEDLLTLTFHDLYNLISDLEQINERTKFTDQKTKKTRFKFEELFDYQKNQSSIAAFFMKQESMNFKTCYYCGIDYINSFKDIGEYENGLDFINKACKKELELVEGIGDKTAKAIINQRPFKNLKRIPGRKKSKEIIEGEKYKGASKNHFTLDHILPQKKYKFLSLCLYNFVPSCYGCNSKFKKAIDFTINPGILKVSPTSDEHSLSDDFRFKLIYSSTLENVTSEKDFKLTQEIISNNSSVEEYLCMFKIKGRYVFHKDIINDLIQKKIEYSEKRQREIISKIKISKSELRELVFGKEFFDRNITDVPFLKVKRDIAKFIGIKDVV